MMALSALSLAHQDGGQNVLALQHYQLAFPSLQTSLRHNQDLCSDGLFLTHFLLLVYEVSMDRFRDFTIFLLMIVTSGEKRLISNLACGGRTGRLKLVVPPYLTAPPDIIYEDFQIWNRAISIHSLVGLQH
jgi:hypothetical protein